MLEDLSKTSMTTSGFWSAKAISEESSVAIGRAISRARAQIASARERSVSHLRILDIRDEFSLAFKRNLIAAHDSRRCRIKLRR